MKKIKANIKLKTKINKIKIKNIFIINVLRKI